MEGYLQDRQAERNFHECRLYTRRHAKSFYFASHVLPREKRRAAYAVYAFCRYADNIVDSAGVTDDATRALSRLRTLRDQLRYLYTFSPLMDPRFLALRQTAFRYHIPQEYFMDLIRGVEMDLERQRYETFGQLKEYCYCVASVVGLIMARIFGVTDEGALLRAADMGTAMQLTNILRDVAEDYGMGRIYLPAEEMQRFGVGDSDLARGAVTPGFQRLMAFQIERARTYYRSAQEGFSSIPDDGSRLCARLMGGIYEGILDRIETSSYDVFTSRVYVPPLGKLKIALRHIFRLSAAGGGRPDHVRSAAEDRQSPPAGDLADPSAETVPHMGVRARTSEEQQV